MSAPAQEAGSLVTALTGMIAPRSLPDPLPADPMPLLSQWFEEARGSGQYDDFNAMTLATASQGGAPSARIVLCKNIELERPALVFYTNYTSRKGVELEANPLAAAVFHWPHAKRQVRVEGRVERTTAEESDAYFQTRPLLARIGAAVSPQSKASGSRESVVSEALRIGLKAAAGAEIRRPPDWGGYRIIVQRTGLWCAGAGRLHDRAVWERPPGAKAWSATRLGA